MAASNDFVELVWEDGKLLMRGGGRSSNISPSSFSYTSSPNPKAKIKSTDNGDSFPRKKSRLGTVNSGSYSLNSAHQEFGKNDECSFHPVFSRFMETCRDNTYDKYMTEPQIVPESLGENSRPVNASHEMEIPQLNQHCSTFREYQVLAPFGRSMINDNRSLLSMGGLVKSSEPGKDLGFKNFSLFLRPNEQHQDSRVPEANPSSPRVRELLSKIDKNPVVSSEYDKECCKFQNLRENGMCQVRQTNSHSKGLPDEQSEAPLHRNASKQVLGTTSSSEANTVKRKYYAGKSLYQLAPSTSMSSLGTSDDQTHSSLKWKNDFLNEEHMASLSESGDEEAEVPKSVPFRAISKKKRTPEVHKLSERKRRDKINKKMRELQALLPNYNMSDKATMLDNAIEYTKSLQLQVKMLSSGSHICMPTPQMMIRTAMQATAQLAHFSPMGLGMGMGMGMGRGMAMTPLPFPNPAMLSQMIPMPIASQTPLIFPLIGGSSVLGVAPFSVATANSSEMASNHVGLRVQAALEATRPPPTH